MGRFKIKKHLQSLSELPFLVAIVFSVCVGQLQAKEEIPVSTESEYPPFSDEKMDLGGLFPAITTAVFDNMGYGANIKFMPFKRALLETEHMQSLVLVAASKNAEREKIFYYSDPIYTVKQSLFTQENSPIRSSKEEDLKGLSVCRPLGNNLKFIQSYLDAGLISLSQPSSFKQCFEMLRLGRVQLVQVSYAVGHQLLRELYGDSSGVRALERPLKSNTVHFVVSRKHPDGKEWIEKINASYRQLSKSGEIQKVIQAFF